MQSSDRPMRCALIRVKMSNPDSFPSFGSPLGSTYGGHLLILEVSSLPF